MLEEPNCSIRSCKHYQGVVGTCEDDIQINVCRAFPNGIPEEIAYGNNDHTKPFPGDNGITYEEGEMDDMGDEEL